MKRLLWLDDYRNPFENNRELLIFSPIGRDVMVTWCKNYEQFCYELAIDFPDGICFDYDLEEEKTGYDCAKFLVEWCSSQNLELPKWNVHSANPIGREKIESLLNNFNSKNEN